MKTSKMVMIVMLLFAIAGCDSSSSGVSGLNTEETTTENNKPSRMEAVRGKALFVGKKADLYSKVSILEKLHQSLFSYAYAEDTSTSVIYQINDDGTIEIVPFYNSNGEEIIVNVQSVKSVNPKVVGISLTANMINYTVAGEIDSGKLYDISEYDLDTLYQGTTDDDILTIYAGEIKKISLRDKTVKPINNARIDYIKHCVLSVSGRYDSGTTKIDYSYIYWMLIRDNKIWCKVGSGDSYKLFDPSGVDAPIETPIPIKYIGEWNGNFDYYSSILYNGRIFEIGVSYSNELRLYTPDFLAWNSTGKYDIAKLSSSNTREKLLRIQHNYLPHETDRYIVTKYGYSHTSIGSDNEISADWVQKDLGYLYELEGNQCVVGSTIYGYKGKDIYKSDLISDSALVKITTVNQSIAKLWRMSGDIYYTLYTSSSSYETYKISSKTGEIKIVDSVESEAKDLVEFSLYR